MWGTQVSTATADIPFQQLDIASKVWTKLPTLPLLPDGKAAPKKRLPVTKRVVTNGRCLGAGMTNQKQLPICC